jgi:hypothetical protein
MGSGQCMRTGDLNRMALSIIKADGVHKKPLA